MAGAHTLTFNEDNFEAEVLKSDVPVLVDFWASWCGPCLMLAPIIDELAETFAGRAKVGKIDVDACGTLASMYAVQSIPTVLLFQGGEPVERIVGVKHKRDYETAIKNRLGG